MPMSINARKLGLATLAALVGACSIFGSATNAIAADANIDSAVPKSLTVHKFEQPAAAKDASDGTVQDVSGLTPMEGVEFTVSKVNSIGGVEIDLNDSSSWDLLSKYLDGRVQFDSDNASMTALTPVNTNSAGEAVLSGLASGAYWVQETGLGDYDVIAAMEPFLVTVPMPGTLPGEWIYDVHAYPKSSVIGGSKSADHSQSTGLGSNVQWTVLGAIPNLGGSTFDRFTITDTLPIGMAHTSQKVNVRDAHGEDVDGFETPADYVIETSGAVSTLKFTVDGLGKLEAIQGGAVEFGLATTVSDIGSGTLVNNAVIGVNDANVDVAANTTWGSVHLTKHVEGEKSAVLGGANFQVFASEPEAAERVNPIQVNGVSTFTTDEVTGQVSIDGLYAAPGGTDYWLVETKAPAGYLAKNGPFKVTVIPGSLVDALQVAVPNQQAPAGSLPQLGGTGLLIAVSGGAAAIAGGIAITLSGRRRKVAA